jgi:hypothetical protein
MTSPFSCGWCWLNKETNDRVPNFGRGLFLVKKQAQLQQTSYEDSRFFFDGPVHPWPLRGSNGSERSYLPLSARFYNLTEAGALIYSYRSHFGHISSQ